MTTVDGSTRNPARKPVEVGSLSHYLQDFIHPRWLFGISSINSMTPKFARETFVETLARVPGGDCFPLNVPRDLSQMSNIQSLMTFHETDWFIGVLKSPRTG